MWPYRIRTPGIRVNDLSFEDVVRSSNRKEFVFDAYGQRSLIFFPLMHHQVKYRFVRSHEKSASGYMERQTAVIGAWLFDGSLPLP